MRSFRKNFTLIEILATAAIITILAVIGFGSYSYARDKARDAACRALIKQLEAGLETFKTKYGYYPPSPNNGNYVCLTINNSDDVPDRWEMIFGSASSDFTIGSESAPGSDKAKLAKADQLKTFLKNLEVETLKGYIVNNVIEDPWGGRIYYRCPGIINRGSFDLISAGPDGLLVFDGKKPLSSTYSPSISGSDNNDKRQNFLEKYKDSTGEWLCDDIANF